jgi:Terminase large subunit, T4likevirus-type, N-terminal
VPRQCQACVSLNRAAFEAAVAGGQSVRAAAAASGLHRDAAYRHIRNHGRVEKPRRRGNLSVVEPWTPVDTFRTAFGVEPMPHQITYLESTGHLLVRKGRQTGMTLAGAALAIHVARATPGNLAAVISPSLRQSTEVATRARVGLWELGERLVQDSASLLRLANGSRILSLPGSARGVRGYAAALVIIDEASWVDDETFTAARALVAATGGRLIVQSTPGVAGVGFFHALATETPADWSTIVVRSDEASIIDPAFLERERAEMTENLFSQEYMAEFGTGAVGGVGLFTPEMIDSMFVKEESTP